MRSLIRWPPTEMSATRSARKRDTRLRSCTLLATVVVAGFLLAGCQDDSPSVLDPHGPRAELIELLWWVLFAIGSIVGLIVVALIGIALLQAHRRSQDAEPLPEEAGGTGFILGGAVITGVIMMGVFGFTLWTMNALADPDDPIALTVEVTGNQWWWEVTYPEDDVVTANEVHIPVDQPVLVKLTSDDVIHSFWVPELAGKLDLLPGITNEFWIEADEPGIYRGQCAEFCGTQHALMQFLVVAQPREDFDAWLEQQRQPAVAGEFPLIQEGQDLFFRMGCAACHTVRGTDADGKVGPDLTHLASRRTLAAGTLEFNNGNLYGWVADPQAIKPGARMPNLRLTRDELYAIVAYLLSLK